MFVIFFKIDFLIILFFNFNIIEHLHMDDTIEILLKLLLQGNFQERLCSKFHLFTSLKYLYQ